jgi:hypothetical protein
MGVKHTPTALQKLRPSRDLRLDAQVVPSVGRASSQMMDSLRILWMPKLFNILSEKSKERFSNRKLEAAKEKGVLAAWEAATPALRELQDIVKKESNGPFILPTGGKLNLRPDRFSTFSSKANFSYKPSFLCRFLVGRQSPLPVSCGQGYFRRDKCNCSGARKSS